jgi:hypothetical protein
MKVGKRFTAAVAVPILAGAGAFAIAGTAHASAGVTAPALNRVGTAGYEAAVLNDNQTYLTHITGYMGMGNPQYGGDNPTLPSEMDLGGAGAGTVVPIGGNNPNFVIPPSARVGLDDGSGTDNSAYILAIPVSTDAYDDVAFYGNTSIVNGRTTITSGEAEVLLANVKSSHTSQLDVLYDGLHNYDGYSKGSATFFARDLSAKHPTSFKVNLDLPGTNGEFYHGVAGVVSDPPTATTLGKTLPVAGTKSQIEVVFAHVALNGNTLTGSGKNNYQEFYGTLQSGAAWSVVPDVFQNKQGNIEAGPGVFFDDHFDVYAGN